MSIIVQLKKKVEGMMTMSHCIKNIKKGDRKHEKEPKLNFEIKNKTKMKNSPDRLNRGFEQAKEKKSVNLKMY